MNEIKINTKLVIEVAEIISRYMKDRQVRCSILKGRSAEVVSLCRGMLLGLQLRAAELSLFFRNNGVLFILNYNFFVIISR